MRKWEYLRFGTMLLFLERCPSYWFKNVLYNQKAFVVGNLPLRFTPVDINNDMN